MADWRGYDRIAEEYERVHAPRMALPAHDLVTLAGVDAGSRVLDVGTGTGVAARAASKAGARLVVGVDVSPAMLRVAMKRGSGPLYAAAAAIDLPFRDSTFDRLVGNFVLSHFIRYETALYDMLRVLRPGGRIAVSSWAYGEDAFSEAWQEVALSFASKEIIADARHRAMPWDEFFANPAHLKDALHDAGLRSIRVEKREYRFDITAEDYLAGREIASTGRFLREMLGEQIWETFRERTQAVFAERFPARFNDFRDVVLAVGHRP